MRQWIISYLYQKVKLLININAILHLEIKYDISSSSLIRILMKIQTQKFQKMKSLNDFTDTS